MLQRTLSSVSSATSSSFSLRAASGTAGPFPDASSSVNGHSATVTLTRPQALNALTLPMIRHLTDVYKNLDVKPEISSIVLKGEGRAFCAGGDIVQIYHSGLAAKDGSPPNDGDKFLHESFFSEEYELDLLIANLKTPHVSLLDGITMGGGVGLSVHGTFRVATENTMFAMPETGIGFLPDVGGTYFLPRLPGKLGTYMALTGQRLKGVDTVRAGVATHYVQAEKLEGLEAALSQVTEKSKESVNAVIAAHAEGIEEDTEAQQSWVVGQRQLIDESFQHDTIEEIIAALQQDGSEFALKTVKSLNRMSPSSLKITLRQMKEGQILTLEESLRLEKGMVSQFMKDHDFFEGVRALLVDKDNAPQWNPAELSEVSESFVGRYFSASPSSKL